MPLRGGGGGGGGGAAAGDGARSIDGGDPGHNPMYDSDAGMDAMIYDSDAGMDAMDASREPGLDEELTMTNNVYVKTDDFL